MDTAALLPGHCPITAQYSWTAGAASEREKQVCGDSQGSKLKDYSAITSLPQFQSSVPEDTGCISSSSQCLLSWSILASLVREVDMKEIGGVMFAGRREYSSLAP